MKPVLGLSNCVSTFCTANLGLIFQYNYFPTKENNDHVDTVIIHYKSEGFANTTLTVDTAS